MATVPLVHKPFIGQSIDICPTCHTIHLVKTVHLWLDADGSCLVSAGVLNDLKAAGMPNLTIVETVANPPALHLGYGRTREQIDYSNRTQTIYRGALHG